MPDIGRLIADHDALDLLADRLIAGARPGRASAASCRAILDDFVARLDAHLASEERCAHDGQAEAERDFAALTAVWLPYLDRWDIAAIAADRTGFWLETTDVMTAVKLRIAAENEALYPLAVEAGGIGEIA